MDFKTILLQVEEKNGKVIDPVLEKLEKQILVATKEQQILAKEAGKASSEKEKWNKLNRQLDSGMK